MCCIHNHRAEQGCGTSVGRRSWGRVQHWGSRVARASYNPKGPSTLATLFNHMWPRIVAGIFIPVGNHYFQALVSTLQFVAQVCDRLWLVPATDRAFAYITYMSPPHVAATCRSSVLGSTTMRGHMWLNKVASVLGP